MLGIFLNRKNMILILMAIELILLAVNINLVAFSAYLGDLVGQVFAMFVLTVAAGEAAIGLAILVIYFRRRGTIAVDDVNRMQRLMHARFVFIVFLPLLAAIVAGLGNRALGKTRRQGAHHRRAVRRRVLSWPIFLHFLGGDAGATVVPVLDWIHSGDLDVDWALRVDSLTAVMLVVVTTVSALVHLYSWGYMEEDPTSRASSPICRCSPSRC